MYRPAYNPSCCAFWTVKEGENFLVDGVSFKEDMYRWNFKFPKLLKG